MRLECKRPLPVLQVPHLQLTLGTGGCDAMVVGVERGADRTDRRRKHRNMTPPITPYDPRGYPD